MDTYKLRPKWTKINTISKENFEKDLNLIIKLIETVSMLYVLPVITLSVS